MTTISLFFVWTRDSATDSCLCKVSLKIHQLVNPSVLREHAGFLLPLCPQEILLVTYSGVHQATMKTPGRGPGPPQTWLILGFSAHVG